MCIFSAPVQSVAATSIIAGKTKNGNIRIIYSNKVACDNGSIMVLPIPSDKIKLIQLPKKYNDLGQQIVDCYNYFLPTSKLQSYSTNSISDSNAKERVFKYGPYDVSLTTKLENVNWEHFGGLENSKKFFDLMYKKYSKCTFLIAKIRNSGESNKLPICYEFAPDSSNNFYFLPTFHIHDAKPEKNPEWDHYIFILNSSKRNILNKLYSGPQNNQNNPDQSKKFFGIDNFSCEAKLTSYEFKEFFYPVRDLLRDKIFQKNPFQSVQSVLLLRISGKKFLNKDIVCSFSLPKKDIELAPTDFVMTQPYNPNNYYDLPRSKYYNIKPLEKSNKSDNTFIVIGGLILIGIGYLIWNKNY